jgi:hypothetical protein
MGFWESVGGQSFVQGTVPRIGKALERIANALEEYNKPVVMTAEQLSNSGTREDALEAVVHELLTQIWDKEIAGHIRHETLVLACEVADFEYPSPHTRENEDDKSSNT